MSDLNKQRYYQGYRQCFTDFVTILKEANALTNEKIYLNLNQMDSLLNALIGRIDSTFDMGYMYYDTNLKKFEYRKDME